MVLRSIREDMAAMATVGGISILFALMVSSTGSASGPSPGDASPNGGETTRTESAGDPDPNVARTRLQQQMGELRKHREELQSDLDAARRALPSNPAPGILDAIERGLDDARFERALRLQRLRQRLSQLDDWLQTQPACGQSVEDQAPPSPDQVPTESPQPAQQEAPPSENEDENEAETKPGGDAMPLADAIPVMKEKEPVDRLALADNLFATREMQLALGIYESIDPNQLEPDDRLWVWYQMGCCQRALANHAEAERFFRMVVGASTAGSLFDNARWRLESMGRHAAIEGRLAKVSEALETLGRKSNESE